MKHSQDHDDREMPDASPEESASASLGSLVAPETPSLTNEPGVDETAGEEKGLVGDADGPETETDGETEDGVTESDSSVGFGIDPCQHPMARLTVLVANIPAERVEMRELPGEDQRGQKPSARTLGSEKKFLPIASTGGALSLGRCPAHQWRYPTDHRPDPGVEDRHPLHRRIYERVEEDVETA